MGNENQNWSAENRHDSKRTDSRIPLSMVSFYGQLKLIVAFTEGCKAWTEKYLRTLFLFPNVGNHNRQRITKTCGWPQRHTRDKINEKRDSTLLYLAVVQITTNVL